MSDIKPQYYIGIDPDVEASGFAVWSVLERRFTEICCEDLPDLCDRLKHLNTHYNIFVRLEAGWLSKGLNWHKGGLGSANKVGRNHEIGRQIEKLCMKYKIPYMLVKPLGYSDWDHKRFCTYTKWPESVKTNSEKRVAGMMVFGF